MHRLQRISRKKNDDEYRVNMILDNLPVAVLRQRKDGIDSTTNEHGFRVGFRGKYTGSKDEKCFIHNHLSFRVMYYKDLETDSASIVGFEVTPHSFIWCLFLVIYIRLAMTWRKNIIGILLCLFSEVKIISKPLSSYPCSTIAYMGLWYI